MRSRSMRWMVLCLGGALTGCGEDATPTRQAEFASAATLLPAGIRLLELPLVECSSNLADPRGFVLTLNDAGDLAVRGAFGDAPVADFITVDYAEATQRYLGAGVEYDASGQFTGGAYAGLERGNDGIDLDAYGGSIEVDAYDDVDWVSCVVAPERALALVPARFGDPGRRLARAMFAGVTSVDASYLQRGELTSTDLRWDTWAASATGTTLAESLRFVSFDLATGALHSASTFEAAPTGTLWPLELPDTTPWGAIGANLEEYEDVTAGDRRFEFAVPVGDGGERLSVYVARSGNVVTPYVTYSPNL